MRALLIAGLALALVGCASAPQKPGVAVESPLPSAAMVPCPSAPLLANRTLAELISRYAELLGLYESCAQRNEEKDAWILRERAGK